MDKRGEVHLVDWVMFIFGLGIVFMMFFNVGGKINLIEVKVEETKANIEGNQILLNFLKQPVGQGMIMSDFIVMNPLDLEQNLDSTAMLFWPGLSNPPIANLKINSYFNKRLGDFNWDLSVKYPDSITDDVKKVGTLKTGAEFDSFKANIPVSTSEGAELVELTLRIVKQ